MRSLDNNIEKIEILVLSFDGFEDVWSIFFDSFFKFWPDCPFKINLLTNHKTYKDDRVNSLLVGDDKDWSSSVKKALAKIESEYIFTMFDDLIINDNVKTESLYRFIKLTIEEDINYFRFRPYPPPNHDVSNGYGTISKRADYRVSLTSSLIKKDVLNDLLVNGESAWEFELSGTIRSISYNKFYCSSSSLIPYYNAIEKGKWNKEMIPLLSNYDIDPTIRGTYEPKSNNSIIGNIKHWILFTLIPSGLRNRIIKIVK